MKISIEHRDGKYPTFNVSLASMEGAEPFLTVYDCRIVEGSKGRFISYPAKKDDKGKYWNHVRGSDAFNSAVLAEAERSMPKARASKPADDDDVPF